MVIYNSETYQYQAIDRLVEFRRSWHEAERRFFSAAAAGKNRQSKEHLASKGSTARKKQLDVEITSGVHKEKNVRTNS
jgi:hypothetical protein